MSGRRGRLRVGTSGFHYSHWRGVFYPEKLPAAEWLAFYARTFDTVEINNTFYKLPEPATFEQWGEAVPANFRFAVKYSRFGTHMRRLRAPKSHLRPFCGRVAALRGRLGPILVQLPPHWGADPARLDAFLAARPRGGRWAVEVRDPAWLCDAVYRVLRRHRAALCVHDLIEGHPWVRTAPWMYLRFHGTVARYSGSYSRAQLGSYAARIRDSLREGHDVYVYFNNDVGGYAIANARTLLHLCGA